LLAVSAEWLEDDDDGDEEDDDDEGIGGRSCSR